MGRGAREKGTAGHTVPRTPSPGWRLLSTKGPPSRSTPHSPLRTDERASNKPTLERERGRMPALHFTTSIDGPSERVFELIADITGYDRWLPRSRAFGAVSKVSPTPVGLGTTYVDTGPSGAMEGSITDFQPPTRIAFRQSMPVKLLLFSGTLVMEMRYTLEPIGQMTRVSRDVTFHLPGVLKAAQPIIISTVRRESKRLLQIMKRYVETGPDKDDE